MPKIPTDYSETIIYKLCCKDTTINQIYVGHTTNINKRKHNHKTNCCNSNLQNYNLFVYNFIRENGGWDNWSIIQIEAYNEFEDVEIVSLNNKNFFVVCGYCPQISSTRDIPHPLIYTFIKACYVIEES